MLSSNLGQDIVYLTETLRRFPQFLQVSVWIVSLASRSITIHRSPIRSYIAQRVEPMKQQTALWSEQASAKFVANTKKDRSETACNRLESDILKSN